MKSKEFWIYDNPEWNNPHCYRGEPTWGCEPDDTGRVVHVVEASVVTDLLEALNAMADYFGPIAENMNLNEECQRVYKLAREALAKAEPREDGGGKG